MYKFFKNKERGFTLIELLVVVAMIALLSSIVFAALNTARAKARDAQRKANIEQVMIALELYNDDSRGSYPDLLTDLLDEGKYIDELPEDPLGDEWSTFPYERRSTGRPGYAIELHLETPEEHTCKMGVNMGDLVDEGESCSDYFGGDSSGTGATTP